MTAREQVLRSSIIPSLFLTLAGVLASTVAGGTAAAAEAPASVQLYALDGGKLEFKDLSSFSDTGEYAGQSGAVAVPAFLIRHPKGTLMWDTGLNPEWVKKEGSANPVLHATVAASIAEQLKQIGVTPADVTFVAFSHLHLDHTGNANLFAKSTWIMSKAEIEWATGPAGKFAIDAPSFSAYEGAKKKLIDGDLDVFGDGTVQILRTPGHTPGHQVLLLRLKSGSVLLSGDLYHLRRDVKERLIPIWNTNRADTLASFDRVERLVKNLHARLVVQHDPGDFQSLPHFPAFLQ